VVLSADDNGKHHTVNKSACKQRGHKILRPPGAWNSKHRDGHKCVVDQSAAPSARHVASQRLQMHMSFISYVKKSSAVKTRRDGKKRSGGTVRDVHARKHGGT
jgi:hypothetical protein